jgi:hypothetical protein
VLDRLAKVGSNTVLGSVAIKVMKSFDLDLSHVHHDTTSHTVYGDYRLYEWEGHAQPFMITHGFSKDHRPDLKLQVHSKDNAGRPILGNSAPCRKWRNLL